MIILLVFHLLFYSMFDTPTLLLVMAFQDRPQRDTKSGGTHQAVSMFAGTQSTTSPFRAAGYAAVWNAEIDQEIHMGPLFTIVRQCHSAIPDQSGNYSNGKRGELVRERITVHSYRFE